MEVKDGRSLLGFRKHWPAGRTWPAGHLNVARELKPRVEFPEQVLRREQTLQNVKMAVHIATRICNKLTRICFFISELMEWHDCWWPVACSHFLTLICTIGRLDLASKSTFPSAIRLLNDTQCTRHSNESS